MAEQPHTPQDHEPHGAHAELIEDRLETVAVRRAPKFAVFLVVGALLGLIVAMILTFAFHGEQEASPNTGLVYSIGQVFGFVALLCVAAGVAVGGIVALVFDRTVGRRTRQLTADRETVTTVD
jgi:hypothetical protein